MESRILQLISALRSSGVRVSLAESAEAFSAVDLLGIQDREQFRLSLRATLIKDVRDLPIFDQLFPLFFGSGGSPEMGGNPSDDLTHEEAQMLAEALQRDQTLAGLFRFNEWVESSLGSRYLVDLLWPEGRVVVEVDGYFWHSDEATFARDRRRDYELLITGYVPLRIPHQEIVNDLASSVTRIRRVVEFRRQFPHCPKGDSHDLSASPK